MAASGDLINFDLIEGHKENIQALPSGRSAKALATLLSPVSSGRTPSESHDAHSTERQAFENELQNLDDHDDPLDVYDRYVKWTLATYPSAQAKEAQLLPLLERATKAFLHSEQYKNDARYLRLWLHYIRLFADAPRETFAFLARHHVRERLALYYEEFAAWHETNGRFAQAEEVFALGIDREARPAERLIRKYAEFQHRAESRPQDANEPSSPALPTVRPALAAKLDPFASSTGGSPADPQARDRAAAAAAAARPAKSGKQKLAIFSDDSAAPTPGTASGGEGWASIGSLQERKKENTVEAQPWAGQTMKGGKRNTGVVKMAVFKDQSVSRCENINHSFTKSARQHQITVNPRTGRKECVFVNLEAVYPGETPEDAEFCFEELRARHRGWLDHDWAAIRREEEAATRLEAARQQQKLKESTVSNAAALLAQDLQKSPVLPDENDENAPPSQAEIDKARLAKKQRREDRANRTRKIRVMEVRGETQTVRTNLSSPQGPKLKRKKSAEPTMTINTKEAMDEIYGIFNQPLKSVNEQLDDSEGSEESEEEDDEDDYTSGGESTTTGRISGTTSEYGDDTAADFTEAKSVSGDDGETGFSDFSMVKPNQHLDQEQSESEQSEEEEEHQQPKANASALAIFRDNPPSPKRVPEEDIVTPTETSLPTRFVPVPPEDYEPPRRTYRDQKQLAQNRLPFMTPIVEKSESVTGTGTALAEKKDYFTAKTPCRNATGKPGAFDDPDELLSSPFQELTLNDENNENAFKVPQPPLPKPKPGAKKVPLGVSKSTVPAQTVVAVKEAIKGPIIKDSQCNPVDEYVRQTILDNVQPPLASYDGYQDLRSQTHGRSAEIRKFCKAVAKMSKNNSDKTTTNLTMPPILNFGATDRSYTVKRELGKGAFAPVYLVENSAADDADDEADGERPAQMGKGSFGTQRNKLEAIKMEDPPTAWEFYMLRQAKRRLGIGRAADSIVQAYEMHLYADECFLIEEYREQGTLLDVINMARADINGGGVMDETLAMFFTIELFRVVEALHAKGLIHGDLKADNVLVRLDSSAAELDPLYSRGGRGGWAGKGVALIDFGRGIDMKAFRPDVQFIADWKTSEADCAEMRELRPWTYQVDYHGLAGIVHSLLFGKYIETIAERGAALGAGATKTYRIRENLKRYWQTEIWSEVFGLLLNPLQHLEAEEGTKLPVLKGMKGVRERMEAWLEENCERGMGLRKLVRKVEEKVKERKK